MSLKMTLTKKSFRVLLVEGAVENPESRTRKISPDSEFCIRPALEYCDEWNSEFVLLRRAGGIGARRTRPDLATTIPSPRPMTAPMPVPSAGHT